jgi:hypothetical protein
LKPERKFWLELKEKTPNIVKPLASRDWKLYEGKDVLELDARGLLLEARCSGLEACCSLLETLA